jgi:hypothetical protein
MGGTSSRAIEFEGGKVVKTQVPSVLVRELPEVQRDPEEPVVRVPLVYLA